MKAHHLDDLDLLTALSSVAPRRIKVSRHLAHCSLCRDRQEALRSWVPSQLPHHQEVPDWEVINPILQEKRPTWRGPFAAMTAGVMLIAGLWWPHALWNTAPTGFDAASILLFGQTREMQVIHGHGQVIVKYSKQGQWALIETHALAPLPQGRIYEAWWIDGTQHDKAAVFSTQHGGQTSLWIHHNAPLKYVNGLGITLEPSPGTSKPTGPKAFFLKLPSSS